VAVASGLTPKVLVLALAGAAWSVTCTAKVWLASACA
jgi:hypothetical protein